MQTYAPNGRYSQAVADERQTNTGQGDSGQTTMSASETLLFLGLPIVSFTIGFVLAALATRRAWSLPRAQFVAAGICFLLPLTVFFAIEFQAVMAADRGFGAAVRTAGSTAVVLSLACVPLAPIPAFIGAQIAARLNTSREDEIES